MYIRNLEQNLKQKNPKPFDFGSFKQPTELIRELVIERVRLVASRLRIHGRSGIGAARGAFHIGVDRSRAAAAEIAGQRRQRHAVRAVLAVFQRPLLDRTVDQAEVVDASIFASGFTSFDEVRDRNRGQETDDGDDDHDFNEREARFA